MRKIFFWDFGNSPAMKTRFMTPSDVLNSIHKNLPQTDKGFTSGLSQRFSVFPFAALCQKWLAILGDLQIMDS